MEKWLADKIANWCIKQNSVSDVQEIAIRYGIELYFDTLVKIVLLLCIGIIFGRGKETAISIFCFCVLRGEAGGFHMKSSIGCFLSMLIMVLMSVIGAEILPELPVLIILVIFIICIIAAKLYAPSSTSNNPIEDDNIIRRKKKKSLLILLIYAVITFITQNNHLRLLILLPVIIEIITILPIWKRKEGSSDVKEKAAE